MQYAAGDGAPGWFSIQGKNKGDSVKIQNYSSASAADNIEIMSTTAGHTPVTLWFNQPVATAAETINGGCQILDRIGDCTTDPQNIYCFTYRGYQYISAYSNTFPNAGPSQILTSPGQSGVRGFMVNNYTSVFAGAPANNYIISATYMTGNKNPCAAADHEMGMWQFLQESDRIVYFDLSAHTTCNGH